MRTSIAVMMVLTALGNVRAEGVLNARLSGSVVTGSAGTSPVSGVPPRLLELRVKRVIAGQIDDNNWEHSFGRHWASVVAGGPVIPMLVTHTDPESLELDTVIYDDDIANVELVMRLEKTFGITILDEEAEAIFATDPTVGRLVRCVRAHLKEKRR